MKAVITRQKYKCDFCKIRSTKTSMEKHERRCFRNPNRFCDTCKNTGEVEEEFDNGYEYHTTTIKVPCHFCSKRDPKVEEGIKKWEAEQNRPESQVVNSKDLPF